MNEDVDFYTATMAKLYAKQGHIDKCVEIYRYLLAREPGRQDLREALDEIEAKRLTGVDKNEAEIVLLMEKWIGLVLAANQLKMLKEIQRKHFVSKKTIQS